jgi:hypothetical protein
VGGGVQPLERIVPGRPANQKRKTCSSFDAKLTKWQAILAK